MKIYYYTFIALILFLLSCRKEYEPIAYRGVDGTALIPLVNSELTVERLIKKHEDNPNFEIRSDDGLVTLVYKTLRKERFTDYYTLPNTSLNETITVADIMSDDPALSTLMGVNPSVVVTSNDTYTSNFSFPVQIDLNQYHSQLVYVLFLGGTLQIEVEQTVQHQTDVQLRIPGLQKNGLPFTQNIRLTPSQSSQTIEVNLNGYRLDFKTGGNSNEFDLEGELQLTGQPGNVLAQTDGLNIDFDLLDLEYDLLFGQVGEFTIDSGLDTMEVNAFDHLSEVDFQVKEPKIILNTYLSAGAPSTIYVDRLSMASPNQETVDLVLVDNEFEINQLVSVNAIGDSALTQDIFTNASIASGPDFTDAIRNGKKEIITATRYKIGDAGITSDFFISNTSALSTQIIAELPLEVNLQNYQVVDTLDNELKGLEELKSEAELKTKQIRVFTVNSFPVEMDLRIIFLDEQGNYLDEAFQVTSGDTFIGAAEINAAGESQTPFSGKIVFDIGESLFENMIIADKIVVVAGAKTTSLGAQQFVRILDWNSLKIRMDFLTEYKQIN